LSIKIRATNWHFRKKEEMGMPDRFTCIFARLEASGQEKNDLETDYWIYPPGDDRYIDKLLAA
jgi:hypothetical protein